MGPNDLAHNRRSQEEIERQILSALQGIRYGSLEIIVHDSKVVQIERKEKMRIETGSDRARE
jgi:hypothetical protein